MTVLQRPVLLLDLDGTLVDPAEGIIGSCRYAMAQMGRPAPEFDDLSWIIGPSIRTSFAQLLGGEGDVETALGHYRRRYSEWGLTAARAYPGVMQALGSRRSAGTRLFLCTAKALPFAERVVAHFGFAPLLEAVYGPGLDGRLEDKAELMAHLLTRERLSPEQVCMIGDREHDILAARANDVASVGVLWGYGGQAELQAAGADLILRRPAEMLG